MRRHIGRRRYTNPRVLILCEGETEKNYFRAIIQDPDYKYALSAVRVSIYSGKDSSPEKVVKEAVNRSKEAIDDGIPFQEIWVVFDHDNHPNRHTAFQNALSLKFNIAFSSIAFEEWFLLHFVKSTRAFSSYPSLEKELLKHYSKYKKAKQNDFENLKKHLHKAVKNAIWLRKQMHDRSIPITDLNPWIDVDVLVQKMISGKF